MPKAHAPIMAHHPTSHRRSAFIRPMKNQCYCNCRTAVVVCYLVTRHPTHSSMRNIEAMLRPVHARLGTNPPSPLCPISVPGTKRCAHLRHIFRLRSLPPEATRSPSGLQSTAYTSSACPGRSSFSLRVRTSQTFTVESFDPETISLESPDQASWYTAPT
eukprot:scaffold41187_cov30-Tisochrysis_lutea.AAC.1